MEDLTNIYNELIMEHSMNSYNKKKLENADYQELGHNPNCGDEITLELKLDGNKIADMAFTGHGCAISQASTSIMIDTLKGKTIEEALALKNGDVVKALDGLPPVKLHCSVLAEEAIHEAIADYYRKEGKLSEEEIKIKCNLKEHHCESCGI